MAFPFMESWSWRGRQGHLVVLAGTGGEMEGPRSDICDPLPRGHVNIESELRHVSWPDSTSVSALPPPHPLDRLSRPAHVFT